MTPPRGRPWDDAVSPTTASLLKMTLADRAGRACPGETEGHRPVSPPGHTILIHAAGEASPSEPPPPAVARRAEQRLPIFHVRAARLRGRTWLLTSEFQPTPPKKMKNPVPPQAGGQRPGWDSWVPAGSAAPGVWDRRAPVPLLEVAPGLQLRAASGSWEQRSPP